MNNQYRILSLDGGGIRGAFAASFLAEIERVHNIRIADHFDLIAGTSTGAIIGVALALGEPAEQIAAMYRQHGPMIFKQKPKAGTAIARRAENWASSGLEAMGTKAIGLAFSALRPFARWFINRRLSKAGMTFDAILQTKYDSEPLRRALREVYGPRTLEHASTNIVVPAIDLTSGKPVVFKSPHLPEASTRDREFSAVDVVMASTAAPTYFPHASIRQGSAYCDGGLWSNNPAVVGIIEALRIARESASPETRDVNLDNISVLSIGTGQTRYSLAPPATDAGLFWWGPKILDVVLESQSASTQNMAGFLLGDRHHRVDFDLPDGSWQLDSIKHLERLMHIGCERAHEEMSNIVPVLVGNTAHRAAS